jgi:hypothetical protein
LTPTDDADRPEIARIGVYSNYCVHAGREEFMVKPLLFGMIGLIFAWLFYERYWKWHSCIDQALSSCVTPDGANLTSGGMMWGVLSAVFIALAMLSLLLRRWR